MKTKGILLSILTSAALCTAFSACSSKSSSQKESSAEDTKNTASLIVEEAASTSATEPETEPIVKEPSIAAQPDEAYLAINEAQNWIQYWGQNKDPSTAMLSYNAKVAKITGDGQYTVGVTADTVGFRVDTTQDPNDRSVTPSGLMFAAVRIDGAKELFPDAVITIDSIKVDGREIPLIAKNYTSSDNGKELRANIYNTFVGDDLPDDAVSIEGSLKETVPVTDEYGDQVYNENDEPVMQTVTNEIGKAYSPRIVNTDDFATWMTVDVTFTITNTGL